MRPAVKASIVVVNWNTRELLLQCIASIIESIDDAALSYQIVVVDNASSDGSADAVAAQYPAVTLVRSPENLGFARGNNLGFRHATGEYFVLLNSDTIVFPGAVQRLVECLDQQPDVGAVAGEQHDVDHQFTPSGHWFPNVWTDLSVMFGMHRVPRWLADRGHPLARLWFETRTGDVDWLSGSFVAVRRQVLEQAGPLPEEFFMYGEDVEWGWRIQKAGWRLVYLHGTPIIHLENRSSNQLFKGEKPHRLLDGFYTFARRHRHPLAWRFSWLTLASYWTAMAVRWQWRAWRSADPKAGEIARHLRSYARRHVDHVLGRIPPIGP